MNIHQWFKNLIRTWVVAEDPTDKIYYEKTMKLCSLITNADSEEQLQCLSQDVIEFGQEFHAQKDIKGRVQDMEHAIEEQRNEISPNYIDWQAVRN